MDAGEWMEVVIKLPESDKDSLETQGGPANALYHLTHFFSREFRMSRKNGFTLIELPIVVVMIGVLAAIAIPKFANTQEKAFVATMKVDLRNLVTYVERNAVDNSGAYFSGTAAGITSLLAFQTSQNVTVTATAIAGNAARWTAVATHTLTEKICNSSAGGLITCT